MGRNDYSREHIKFNSKVESEEQMAAAGYGSNRLTGLMGKKDIAQGLSPVKPYEVNMEQFISKHKSLLPKKKREEAGNSEHASTDEGRAVGYTARKNKKRRANSDVIQLHDNDILIKIKTYLPSLKREYAKKSTIRLETLVTTAHLDSRVVDQKYVGSCVAFSIVAAMEHDLIRQDSENDRYKFSERQLYVVSRIYYERVCPSNDSGTTHLNALQALKKFGLMSSIDAPYEEDGAVRFWVEAEGIDNLTDDIVDRIEISRVKKDIASIKACIENGYPVILMFRAPYNIFDKVVNDTGLIPESDSERDMKDDNHSVLCVGYDDKRKMLQFKNSWGKDWGVGGYGYIRYENKILNTCWMLKTILKSGEELDMIQ